MTLREYLDKRSRKAVSWGVFVAGMLLVAAHFLNVVRNAGDIYGAAMVAGILVFVMIMRNPRCPKCNERLGAIDYGGRKYGIKPRVGVDRCQNCGLNLNEQIPTKP
jgi:hypothetical protein